jgi:hypothetical protein
MEETKIVPTVGRIVLFKMSDERTFPAIITQVTPETGRIELQIFGTVHEPIRYGVAEGENIGEWSWMPFQKDQQKRAELMAEKIAEEKDADSDVEVSDEEVAADEANEEKESEEAVISEQEKAEGEVVAENQPEADGDLSQPDPSADIADPAMGSTEGHVPGHVKDSAAVV